MFERGFFGKMFDLDGDGKLNAVEMAADYDELMNEDKGSDSDDFDDDFSDESDY